RVAGVGDRVPEPRRNMEAVALVERNGLAVEAQLARARDDVRELLRPVLHRRQLGPGREDRVAERACGAFDEHARPASLRQLDRLDVFQCDDAYSAHSPSFTMYVPSSTICSVAFRKTPSRWSEQWFCPP